MSIIKKLSQARLMLANRPLKKSGINKFAGFHYFELADFLPAVVEIFAELEMIDTIKITNCEAVLTIHTDGQAMEFTCPVPESIPELKGQNPLQVVGSMQTYLRRYLYVTALGIVENDVVDAVEQKQSQKEKLPAYPSAQMIENLPKWRDNIEAGKADAARLIAMISSKYTLSNAQIAQIQSLEEKMK